MSEIIITETFVVIHCGGCNVTYAITETFEKTRRRDHKTFYCPNGCSRYYPHESDIDKERRLAKEATDKANRLQNCIDHKREVIRKKEYQLRHFKGEVTKLKRRAT